MKKNKIKLKKLFLQVFIILNKYKYFTIKLGIGDSTARGDWLTISIFIEWFAIRDRLKTKK